ncbi:MAG: hypothetical protein M1833_002002 [Piccolia ochrophora]|nr:MAG: hypothetical protein M1833_002002 [Piccolia ochrophora]
MAEKDLPEVPAYALDHDSVYGGLQRDFRDEKDLDTFKTVYMRESGLHVAPVQTQNGGYYSEMEARPASLNTQGYPRALHGTMGSPGSGYSTGSRASSSSPLRATTTGQHLYPVAQDPSSWFLRRRKLLLILLPIITILVAGGVVGGVLGVMMTRKNAANAASRSASDDGADSRTKKLKPAPPLATGEPGPHDPTPGGSMAAFAYSYPDNDEQQSVYMFYQEVNATVVEVDYASPVPGWTQGKPIFTDAKNFTGLAAFNYLNGTDQCGYIVYISTDNALQAKALTPAQTFWDYQFSMSKGNFLVDSFGATAEDSGSSKLTAVYSRNFAAGPGARLFYHTGSQDQSKPGWVQELIWDQTKDTWNAGQAFEDPVRNSNFAAVIDGDMLRFFYSIGGGTVQESVLDIRDPDANYTKGITKPNMLARDDAPMAASTIEGTTSLFHTAADGTIQELLLGEPITGGFESTVAKPGPQAIIPLATARDSSNPDKPSFVFYTEFSGGNAAGPDSAVDAIFVTQRNASDDKWPTNPSFQPENMLSLYPGGDL